jgi:hypothetical protein
LNSKRNFKPCEYCKKHHPELAEGHPNEKCWSDKSSPAFKGNRNAKIAIEKKGSSKKKKPQVQLTRADFKTKSGYELFNSNQIQMNDFLKRVTVKDDGDDDESSKDE